MLNGHTEQVPANLLYAQKADVDRLAQAMHELAVSLAVTNNELKNTRETFQAELKGMSRDFLETKGKIEELMDAHKHRSWLLGLIKASPKFALTVILAMSIIGFTLGSGIYKEAFKYWVKIEKIRNSV